jgi:hypothetical protein
MLSRSLDSVDWIHEARSYMGMERNFFLPSHQAKLFPLSGMIETHYAVRDSQVRSTKVHNRMLRSPLVCPTTPFHRTECSACCLECQARWMARPDGRGNVNCAWQTRRRSFERKSDSFDKSKTERNEVDSRAGEK